MPPDKIDHGNDRERRQQQDQQTSEVDIADPEARCEPGFGEGPHVEHGGKQIHRRADELVEAGEDAAERRCRIGGLQNRITATTTAS